MVRDGFHDVLFPLDISLGARGGPQRKTDVTTLASGGELRRARWSRSRRAWDVRGAVRTFADAENLIAFFEEREGRRYAFRFRDPFDFKSNSSVVDPTATDQLMGEGDGQQTVYKFAKAYGSSSRSIELAVNESVRIAVDGEEVFSPDWVLDAGGGSIEFSTPPTPGSQITAGFLFDTPCRFDSDLLELQLGARGAGLSPVKLIETRL